MRAKKVTSQNKANLLPIFLPPRFDKHIVKSYLPSPLGDYVVIGEKSRHSGESRNPFAALLNNSIFLDSRWSLPRTPIRGGNDIVEIMLALFNI
jgi:hypothetical protein